MPNPLNLDRQVLARFLPNHQSILAFEKMQNNVNAELPSTIEEAASLAALATAIAQQAIGMLGDVMAEIEQLQTAPRAELGTISAQNADAVDVTGGRIGLDAGNAAAPSLYFGGDDKTGIYRSAVDVLDISIFGTKLVELSALLVDIVGGIRLTKQITSTLATGTAPFVVASSTNVLNLNASSLNGATFAAPGAIGGTTPGSGKFTTFGCNGAAPQAIASLTGVATDLPTVIALANSIRAALAANGIGF